MIDIGYILLRLADALDKNHYFGEEATDQQIVAIRIYLQGFVGHDDNRRYRLIQNLFDLAERPRTSKALSKGQASALIGISRHQQYGPILYDYIRNLA